MADDYEAMLAHLVARCGRWFDDPATRAAGRMSCDLYPYTALFSPIQVNALTLKNRIVMGPMGNINLAEEMGRPSRRMVQYFAERARGGAGLITSGLVPVSQGVEPTVTERGGKSYFPRIDGSRTVFSGWRELARTVHAYGARFFIQLTPGLGRVGSPECLLTKHRLPVSASWNPSFYMPAVPCRPLTDGECGRIIRAAGQAAADARALLVDGVYLHGHEGYLLEQMSNRAFNRRRLGRYRDWRAFGLELVREVRARCAPSYPIMYRIDLSLALTATYGERMRTARPLRTFRRERTVAETLAYMAELVRAGVDLFDVDLGCYDNWWLPHPPGPMPPGVYLAVAQLVRSYLAEHSVRSNAGLEVPVVAVGKLGYPDLAERALRDGLCDMVMLARPLLADPEWPAKAYAGRVEEIVPCIGDQEGCLNEFLEGGHVQCAVNPRTGLEDLYPAELRPAPRPKRIAVVGAGPAGVLAATTAARRGHRVTLFERQAQAGGTLIAGSVPAIKFDLANYVEYLQGLLARTARDCELEIRFESEATVELLGAAGYDAVVTCTGALPLVPPVPGVELPHVVQAVDLLRRPELAKGRARALVVGGGAAGCETAYWLASELGLEVTVVEMLPAFMTGVCTANRGYLIHYLEQAGVRLLNCTRLLRVDEGSASVARNVSPTVPDPYVAWTPLLPENIRNPLARPLRVREEEATLPADLVVLATGMRPDSRLYEACLQAHVAGQVHNIGDSFSGGRVFEAVKAGYTLGMTL